MEKVPMSKRFCTTFRLWFGEYVSCEEPDCRLETDKEAAERVHVKTATRKAKQS